MSLWPVTRVQVSEFLLKSVLFPEPFPNSEKELISIQDDMACWRGWRRRRLRSLCEKTKTTTFCNFWNETVLHTRDFRARDDDSFFLPFSTRTGSEEVSWQSWELALVPEQLRQDRFAFVNSHAFLISFIPLESWFSQKHFALYSLP